jgi:hypothetical protein
MPSGGFVRQSWMSLSWYDFGEFWKYKYLGGMYEVEPKSVKSTKTKRQQVCG